MVLKLDYGIFYDIFLVFLDKNILKFKFLSLKTQHILFSIIKDD
jgi:hypothetical protein